LSRLSSPNFEENQIVALSGQNSGVFLYQIGSQFSVSSEYFQIPFQVNIYGLMESPTIVIPAKETVSQFHFLSQPEAGNPALDAGPDWRLFASLSKLNVC
jgi:hypothetical protein